MPRFDESISMRSDASNERLAGPNQRKQAQQSRTCVLQYAPLTKYYRTNAAIWLSQRYKKHEVSWSQQDFERLVDTWFLDIDQEDLVDLQGQAKDSSRKRTARAQKWLTDYSLHAWVGDQNERKGLAIPSGALATKREQLLKGHAANTSPAYWLGHVSLPGKERVWAVRLRQQWRVTIGKIKPRAHVQVDVLQNKAPRVKLARCYNRCETPLPQPCAFRPRVLKNWVALTQ